MNPPRSASVPEVQWETVCCPLCGEAVFREVLRATDPLRQGEGPEFVVVRCAACGLCYTNPRPTRESMAAFYPPDYAPHQQIGLTGEAAERARKWSRAGAWLRWRAPHKRGLPVWGQGRLLDVGCGGGAFLHRMQIQGWDGMGLDASCVLASRVRETLGLRVLAGSLPHGELPAEYFDLITLWASLEHMHDPLGTLREVHRLLAPGGRVIISVHNVASALLGLFAQSWFCLDLPRHLVHFSPRTLQEILRKSGFLVVTLRGSAKPDWLRSSVDLASRQGRDTWWLAALRRRPIARVVASTLAMAGRSDGMWACARKI